MQNWISMIMRKRRKNYHKQIPWFRMQPFPTVVEHQHSHISKTKKEDEDQIGAPLELVPSIFDFLHVSQPSVEFKNAKMEKKNSRVVIPKTESAKKWRKLPYSPQWISMLDVAQKIMDEEDRIKKKQKASKKKGECKQADETIGEGKKENKEELLVELCDEEGMQANTVQDLKALPEQLPSPGTSHIRAEKEILTAEEIEGIIQEIVALRAKEKLSEEAMQMVFQDGSSINHHKPHGHRERRMPY
ncbi:uncharacterized protein LOC121920969 [Sceloporus undulatus]|uniref:uncharacterized protein LOC121920969 n=1 Tax=Sceloporus undulatus TaxID=8520 RepID=UPI001C4BFD52|nr:uncharacterized protein LOC121920969 [Sceloporus undulatus]